MERAKTIKNILLGLACLLVLALFGLSIYQQQQLKRLSQGANTESAAVDESAANTMPEPIDTPQKTAVQSAPLAEQTTEGDINNADDLESQLDATEQELEKANKQLADEASRKEELKQKQMELQKQYASDPSFKKYMKASLDTAYADLFKELNLAPEELEKFKDLLVDGAMALNEISPDIMSATTKEQKADLQKRVAAIREENEEKIKEFLGSGYETYHEYTEMETTRYVIKGFTESMNSENQLTKDQEKALTEIMYKEQMKVFAEIGYDPRKQIEFQSDVKSGEADGQLKNMEKIHNASLENSKGVLSAAQLQNYQNYLKSRREMMELSSKLSD